MASRFSRPISHRLAATALLAAMALPVLAQQPPATPPAASAKAAEGRRGHSARPIRAPSAPPDNPGFPRMTAAVKLWITP